MKQLLIITSLFTGLSASAQWYQQPVYAVTSQQPPHSGEGPSNTIDDDLGTIYHSEWGQNGIPDELNFYFTSQVNSIGRIVYSPRQSGSNGIWTDISVYYSTQSAPTNFIQINTNLIWASNNQDKEILLASAVANPYAIKFVVNQGGGNYSSCAEMKFYSDTPAGTADDGVDCTISTAALTVNGANDVEATILAAGSTASSYQSGENINNSFDNDLNTLYHSSWSNTIFPVVLNYRLNGTTPIDYLRYIPRSDGGSNGNFGNVTISYNTTGNSTFQDITTFNFEQSGMPTIVHFPSQITPLNIRFTVEDGYNDFASCAEMEFYTAGNSSSSTPYMNVFANNLYYLLLPNITQAHIDTISQPFYKELAQCLFNESYDHQYRVQAYEVYRTVGSVSNELKIGSYDNFENATGIVFEPGEKIALFARNIPSSASVSIAVKDFAAGFGGAVSYYELQNGLNVFQITNGGLGYISYFNANENLNDVEINIVSGKINGYFDSETSSNSEWPGLMTKSTYSHIDLRGKYVHLVYERASLANGSPFDPIALIGKYDTIVQHERMVMGLFKYNRSPKNRMLTFNEHGGGYYAGGLGVHLDLDWGPEALTDPDYIGIWGIAHEYGHINQTRPDLKWIGTTEVTNNVHSAWVDYHMDNIGEDYTRLEDESVNPATGIPSITGGRINGTIYNTYINGEALQGNADYDVFKVLVPFWQLELYYSLAGASRNAPVLTFDYPGSYTGIDYARWYGTVSEVARTTPNSDQFTNGELLLNFVKNTCDAVQEDLTDFFINTGFLKPIDIPIDDYGIEQLTITQAQIDQVISEIQAHGYTQPVSPVIHYASAHSVHMFRDQLPLSGVTGIGCSLSGNYLNVQHSEWPNAVAYETYDTDNNLIYVSISGSGDPTNQMTKVYYPSNALAVFAVGFDGQKILVYPASILSVNETTEANLTVYPNPVGKGTELQLTLLNASGDYAAQVIDLDGRMVFSANGTIDAIETALNKNLIDLRSGTYILSLENTNKNQFKVKFVKE